MMMPQTSAQGMPIYRFIRPWYNPPITPSNASEVLEEANRVLHHCGHDASFGWAYKARALQRLGRHQEAVEASVNIPARLDMW
jgi:hypothetical protein